MSFSLIPSLIVDRLTDLTPELLHRYGIGFLMLDFDNTIVPYTTDDPTPEMETWLKTMAAGDIGICVVSNSKRDRVVKFCGARGIPVITHSKKPFQKGIRRCKARFGLDMARTAMVGDQIYTDVLGGNRAGAKSILVTPIHLHNIWLKLRHWAEKPFICLGKRRNGRNLPIL